MNNLHARIDDIFRPTPKERYLDYPSKVWDKTSSVDQVKEAEIVQETKSEELHLTQGFYRVALELLLEEIGGKDIFSGAVDFEFSGFECTLACSVLVYRHKVSYPEGDDNEVYDIVGLWWDFYTSKDSEELLNDFAFSKLQEIIQTNL